MKTDQPAQGRLLRLLADMRLLLALVAAAHLVLLVFGTAPWLDLFLSWTFYENGRFAAEGVTVLHGLRLILWDLSVLVAIAALVAVVLGKITRKRLFHLPLRLWNIILWGYLLGPGLLVNAGLKAFSGRARPRDVLPFGGAQEFTAVGRWADQCSSDCSFVSGEVAGTMMTCIAVTLILDHHRAGLPRGVWPAALAGLLASFLFVFWQRVASGGHFTSDALMAALLTAIVAALLAMLWPNPPLGPVDKGGDSLYQPPQP